MSISGEKSMEYIAYCGIKCYECPIYIATEKDDDDMKIQLAKDCSTDKCEFAKDDINCKGCHSQMTKDNKMCGACEIRNCANDKEISTCAECTSYPCKLIDKYVAVGSESRNTLNQIYAG